MTSPDNPSEDSRFRLGGTPQGDLMFYDGPRKIEIGTDTHRCGGGVEITLFANSLRAWEYPYQNDPLTRPIKEEILRTASNLLQSQDARVTVKIEW